MRRPLATFCQSTHHLELHRIFKVKAWSDYAYFTTIVHLSKNDHIWPTSGLISGQIFGQTFDQTLIF